MKIPLSTLDVICSLKEIAAEAIRSNAFFSTFVPGGGAPLLSAAFFSWFRRRRQQGTSAAEMRSFDGGPVIEEPERIALREKHQVRPLTEEEEGTGIDQLPEGVYGFTCAVGQWDAPLFRRRIFLSYEMHKLPDGSPVLVGYVSPQEAERLNRAEEGVTIRLFPDRQGEATELISIPLERVRRHRQHSERTGQGLELELEPWRG